VLEHPAHPLGRDVERIEAGPAGRHRLSQHVPGVLQQPPDRLFVQPWVYRWGLLFEFSVAAYWVGDISQSMTACKKLLTMEELPDTIRQQTRANLQFCVEASARMPAGR